MFLSSCTSLIDINVITQNDFEEIEKIRLHRNLISHEPLRLLIDDNVDVNITLLKKSHELLTKIEKWWLIDYEIPVNPYYDDKEINESEVQSGQIGRAHV